MKREKKQTVAIYSGNIPSTTFIENLIEGMAESGFSILLFGKKTSDVNYKGDVRVIASPQGKIGLSIFVALQSLKLLISDAGKLSRLFSSVRSRHRSIMLLLRDMGAILPVLNENPTLLHVQWAKTLQVYPEFFELYKGKVILSLRGAHINYSPLNDSGLAESYRKYFPKIDAFHAVSKAIAEEAKKYGADDSKLKVIYTSVKEGFIDEKNTLPQNDKLEIISVGRFHWKKGYHYGLDVMKQLKDAGVKCHYSIIAQGSVPEEITFLIDEYGLSDIVTIVPGMPHAELISRLKFSDVLMLTSVEEGIANVVLEAMASGVPVITTDCGGMNEVVENGVNGLISKSRDVSAMANNLIKFTAMNSDEKKSMISNALKTVRSGFSRKRQMTEFAELYRSVLNG